MLQRDGQRERTHVYHILHLENFARTLVLYPAKIAMSHRLVLFEDHYDEYAADLQIFTCIYVSKGKKVRVGVNKRKE